MCMKPLTGWRSRSRGKNGKLGITFKLSEGFADLPVELPCGQCIPCRISKAADLAARIDCEGKMHGDKLFLTLTYRDEALTLGADAPTLVRRDVQSFKKRLRKALWGKFRVKVRTCECGEYGDKTLRPHYHMIVFGWWPLDAKALKKSRSGLQMYTSKVLEEAWGLGHAPFQAYDAKAGRYVGQYVVKKLNGPAGAKAYAGRVAPFIGGSVKLGREYYEANRAELYGRGGEVRLSDGTITRTPRAFDKLEEARRPEVVAQIRAARRAGAKERQRHESVNAEEARVLRARAMVRDF